MDHRRGGSLRSDRDHCPAAFGRGQDCEPLLVEDADLVRLVDALAFLVQKRPLNVNAQNARNVFCDCGIDRLDARADDAQVIADQSWEEAGCPERPMRGADYPDGLNRRRVIEQHTAAAIHLRIDKSRDQEAAAQVVALEAGRNVRSVDDRLNPRRVYEYRFVVNEAVVQEYPAVDKRGRHQIVSVTLRR